MTRVWKDDGLAGGNVEHVAVQIESGDTTMIAVPAEPAEPAGVAVLDKVYALGELVLCSPRCSED